LIKLSTKWLAHLKRVRLICMAEPATNIGWNFDHSYARLPDVLFSPATPATVPASQLVIINHNLASSLGLNFLAYDEQNLAHIFSGQQLPEQAHTIAQAYAGHQYGNFVRLGDGRALLWGEQITPDNQRFDLQFKGSGATVYARRGDGKAALGPMLREYLISEAMHALGIPTTRSLAVVTTGEQIARDRMLPGAILTRVAASHIRVGTFEFLAMQKDIQKLQVFLDYVVRRHYPELIASKQMAQYFLRAVMRRQTNLICNWLRVGFVHGVMNTDNVSIAGETIDYGPCAFIDHYDPMAVFSSIDEHGRYAFANQPGITKWNMARLAEALLPLLHPDQEQSIEIAEAILAEFDDVFEQTWLAMVRSKLGLVEVAGVDDLPLIQQLLDIMARNKLDYINTFRSLCNQISMNDLVVPLALAEWIKTWQSRLCQNEITAAQSLALMRANNPSLISRNHMVEEVLAAAERGQMQPFHTMLAALVDPYSDNPSHAPYQSPPPIGHPPHQTFCGT
jgi:serine/tyrosine/threonine adenylyltransferase